MFRRLLVSASALVAVAGAHPALAQKLFACPQGQALQSIEMNGSLVCIPVPAPVDLAPLQQDLVQEIAERKAADAELAGGIGRASIFGTWVFNGTQTCVGASTFNGLIPAGQTSLRTAGVWGVRTFLPDGRGTVSFTAVAISDNFFSRSTASGGEFEWTLEGDVLTITDTTPAIGPVTHGVNAGSIQKTEDVPPLVGILGKDRRIIGMTHDLPNVEFVVSRSPQGIESRNPRICQRERTLRKLSP